MLGLRLFTFSIYCDWGISALFCDWPCRYLPFYALLKIVMIGKIIGIVLPAERANFPNLMDNIGAFVFFGLILVFFLVAAFYWR